MGLGQKTKRRRVLSRKLRIFDDESMSGRIVAGLQKRRVRVEFHKEARDQADERSYSACQDEWMDITDSAEVDVDPIMAGQCEIPISHAGGELELLLADELRNERRKGHQQDSRGRRDRILKRNQGFADQLEAMVESYLRWSANVGHDGLECRAKASPPVDVQNHYEILVIDIFRSHVENVPLCKGDKGVAAALVGQGLIPCAPYKPKVALTIRVLEIFRVLSLRCPRLAIQNFVKGLCDLHRKPYKQHLNKQFAICQDLYFSILEQVDLRVQKALARDLPQWRLKHACPACTYKLQDEKNLKFNMLFTMDGNDSLKRVLWREPLMDYVESGDGDLRSVGVVNELPDQRSIGGDYYISREEVVKWLKAQPAERGGEEPVPSGGQDDDESPCSERWKNMSEQKTAKAWGIFDETGVFVALCRHGFVLVLTDMVRSGEGSQYPLAVVSTLLETFGSRLGGGYDIGCRFKVTLARSELGALAKELEYTSLVGSFHGHAHNRLCQLSYLATYVDGLGLSDLEGAERLFSRSNDLAASTRHSSIFHRRQRINNFLNHLDKMDTYENLSKFLISNYHRAIDILADAPTFEDAKREIGVTDDEVFQQWLCEERDYLQSRAQEPVHETYEMEYVRRLGALTGIRQKLQNMRQWFVETPGYTTGVNMPSVTLKMETERRHALELEATATDRIHELELKLGITRRWEEGDENWMRATDLLVHRDYRLSLDRLEQLVVQRMFELSRMNRSGTGYKLRQHIAKALKRRCQAIKTALNQYNEAARKLNPPRETLKWEQVVEYAFLSEFDLLADSREDIRQRPWARPVARSLMDQYFKMARAREEIERLDVEIARFLTFMQDEEAFLRFMEDHLKIEHPLIAHQIHLQRLRFELTNREHMTQLQSLLEWKVHLQPGNAVEHVAGELASKIQSYQISSPVKADPLDEDDAQAQEELEEEEAEDELQDDLEAVLTISE